MENHKKIVSSFLSKKNYFKKLKVLLILRGTKYSVWENGDWVFVVFKLILFLIQILSWMRKFLI